MRGPNVVVSSGAAGLIVATSKAGAVEVVCALAQAPAPNSVIAITHTIQFTLGKCLEAYFMKVPLLHRLTFNTEDTLGSKYRLKKDRELDARAKIHPSHHLDQLSRTLNPWVSG
jgi:hypothetical protein